MKFQTESFLELAGKVNFQTQNIRKPEYGRLLEDFKEGDVFMHPRGFTIDLSFAQEFATVFHEACPLFLSVPYAKAHGFSNLVVSPLQVFNIVLSLGVQNNSEKAIANLGYYNVHFTKPVYPGDTLVACTQVLSKRERGPGKPGIVHIRTVGLNQNKETVIQYERKIMIAPRGSALAIPLEQNSKQDFPALTKQITIEVPEPKNASEVTSYTGKDTYWENLNPGMTIVHKNMRTITNEHLPWTYRLGNTHPLHYDRIYSQGLAGKMSGEPIVYGGLVFAWLAGLASRDCSENMLWDMGYTEGYHTQPAVSGDTIGAISRILKVEEGQIENTGLVQIQLIGIKNMATSTALDKYGTDLFIKENDKKALGKEKIPEKIFEIERQLLLKKAKSL